MYVRQQVRVRVATDRHEPEDTAAGKPTAEESPASTGPRAAMAVLDALEQHSHLLVTGEPGAGKSTMTSYLARSLSRLWLRKDSAVDAPITEPVVPLRVFARSLNSSGSWSAVLAEAACHSLGRGLLEDPDPGLFAGRIQGARWLVLVDGLDEIPDPRLRGGVIRSIAQHARPDSDYRFVLTTRALPESELAPLRTANIARQPGRHVILYHQPRRCSLPARTLRCCYARYVGTTRTTLSCWPVYGGLYGGCTKAVRRLSATGT